MKWDIGIGNKVIKQISLYHFRNFAELELSFQGKVLGFVGENGHGKTNILEALYLLSTGMSWRTATLADVFMHGAVDLKIAGSLQQAEGEEIQLALGSLKQHPEAQTARTRYFVNGIARTKQFYAQQAPAIVFAPEDLQAVTGSPSLRREMIDRLLQLTDVQYGHHLRQYQQVITRRNKVLQGIRDGELPKDALDFWTEQMVSHGQYILEKRAFFFDQLQVHPTYRVEYQPNIRDHYREHVEANFYKEVASGTSHYGPHKDDVQFIVDSKDASRFASRGQQRSVMVWFLVQQFEYVCRIVQKVPYVLLDDIFSELDSAHRDQMLDFFSHAQVFVTGCEDRYFEQRFDQIFVVREGHVAAQ